MNKNNPQPISAIDIQLLGAFVEGKACCVPESFRRSAIEHIWSHTYAAFNVSCASGFTVDQLDSVQAFIAACNLYPLELDACLDSDSAEAISPVQRYVVYADGNGRCQVEPIPYDAHVMTHQALLQALKSPGDLALSSDEVFGLIDAAAENLRRRASHRQKSELPPRTSA